MSHPFKIHPMIPYWEQGKPINLGRAYTDAVSLLPTEDYVLFIDHDVYLALHGHYWYQACQRTIAALNNQSSRWGMVTCLTNRIGCAVQKVPMPVDRACDDLNYWRGIAATRADEHRAGITDVTKINLSGFFMLIPVAVARLIGFRDGHLGVDTDFCGRLRARGYTLHRMDDVVVYHGYKREWK